MVIEVASGVMPVAKPETDRVTGCVAGPTFVFEIKMPTLELASLWIVRALIFVKARFMPKVLLTCIVSAILDVGAFGMLKVIW